MTINIKASEESEKTCSWFTGRTSNPLLVLFPCTHTAYYNGIPIFGTSRADSVDNIRLINSASNGFDVLPVNQLYVFSDSSDALMFIVVFVIDI